MSVSPLNIGHKGRLRNGIRNKKIETGDINGI